jgi:hypothetical protein
MLQSWVRNSVFLNLIPLQCRLFRSFRCLEAKQSISSHLSPHVLLNMWMLRYLISASTCFGSGCHLAIVYTSGCVTVSINVILLTKLQTTCGCRLTPVKFTIKSHPVTVTVTVCLPVCLSVCLSVYYCLYFPPFVCMSVYWLFVSGSIGSEHHPPRNSR